LGWHQDVRRQLHASTIDDTAIRAEVFLIHDLLAIAENLRSVIAR
jgi:hypothetical protein